LHAEVGERGDEGGCGEWLCWGCRSSGRPREGCVGGMVGGVRASNEGLGAGRSAGVRGSRRPGEVFLPVFCVDFGVHAVGFPIEI